MTLYRQILCFVLACLICLFCCFWWVQLNSTRNFLENQLQSNAQDTATSLGLSLSVSMRGDGGRAEMETMVNAVFDRGYFRAVVVRDVEDNILFSRERPNTAADVPSWFIRLFPISSPTVESLIMDGWNQAGRLEVKSHPGYGYKNLWGAAKRAALWALGSFLFAAILGGFILKLLLRSLDKVEQQAIDLSNRQYNIQQKIPRTRELKRVVLAMNQMTNKVRDMFAEQTSVVEELRQFSYQDSLTGMGNRRFFIGQLRTVLKDRTGEENSVFFLLHVEGLQQINDSKGYKIGDDLICSVASTIVKSIEKFPGVICGRLSGSDFGLLLANGSEESAERIAGELQLAVQQLKAYEDALVERVSCVGGVIFNGAVTVEEVLSKGDEALRNSSHSGSLTPNIINIAESEGRLTLPRTRLQEILQYALAEKKIALKYRKTIRNIKEYECLQYEILSQFYDEDGNVFSAALFVPVAEQLGLMSALDRLVIEKVLALPAQTFCNKRVTINLSSTSIADAGFVDWLEYRLRQQEGGLRFNFEIPEFLISAHLEEVTAFGKRVAKMGHGIGVDHFGQGLVRFGYLQTLQPDYIKIDRALTQELTRKESDVYFFISSLCTVAHSLDIKVMVDGVENEQQRKLLMELNIDAVQGFYIDKPSLLAESVPNGQ